MNIHAALTMIDFVCGHRFGDPQCNDHTRKELLEAISELADSCVEAIEALDEPLESDKCLTDINLVRAFVEEALKTGNLEYAFSNGWTKRLPESPNWSERWIVGKANQFTKRRQLWAREECFGPA